MSNAAKEIAVIDTLPQQAAMVYTPMAMIDRAISSGASVETLERLMGLQERWEASEAKREFSEAMAAAKAKIKPIIKNRKVSYGEGTKKTEYDHEDLAGIAEQIDPILTEFGLSYRYQSKEEAGKIWVTCIVSHRRGHREETALPAPPDNSGSKNPIQAIGSAVTYLQRYTLKLALGLAATKDSDGAVPQVLPKTIDETQYRYLVDLIEKAAASEQKMLDYCKVKKLEDFTQKDFKWAEAMLRKRLAEGKGKPT